MKLKDLPYFLGLRPEPKVYGYEIHSFELPDDGKIEYAQWLHPHETQKVITQEAVHYLREFIKPGDAAIDIGAHTGDTTIPIALAAGKSGAVITLEPNPFVFTILKKNSELNSDKTNILPLMFAATETDGEYEFEYSDSGFCNGGFHEGVSKWIHGHAFKLEVEGRNLQSYLEQNHASLLPKIKFVKVDVEGYDLSVLKSISRLLAEQRPYIKAEVYKKTNRSQRELLYNFLRDLKYEIFRVVSETNYKGEKIGLENLVTWRHYDVFCVPGRH